MKAPPLKVAGPVGLLLVTVIGYSAVRLDIAVTTREGDEALEKQTQEQVESQDPSATDAGVDVESETDAEKDASDKDDDATKDEPQPEGGTQ